MSIEKDLSRIATALETIAAAMSEKAVVKTVIAPDPVKEVKQAVTEQMVKNIDTQIMKHLEVTAPVVAAPAPIPTPAPVVVPAPAPAAATPTVVAPSGSAPFTDAKGLMEYVMSKYKALGPIKGGEIQGVLGSLGYKNINEVKPEQYGEFYTKVEAL